MNYIPVKNVPWLRRLKIGYHNLSSRRSRLTCLETRFTPLRTLTLVTSLQKEVRHPSFLIVFRDDCSVLEVRKVNLIICVGIAGKREKGGLASPFNDVRFFKGFAAVRLVRIAIT